MILVYRKHNNGSLWHFHTQCPQWPEINYVQAQDVHPTGEERLCEECARLQSQMFPEGKH
jgi:hypothetical protein